MADAFKRLLNAAKVPILVVETGKHVKPESGSSCAYDSEPMSRNSISAKFGNADR